MNWRTIFFYTHKNWGRRICGKSSSKFSLMPRIDGKRESSGVSVNLEYVSTEIRFQDIFIGIYTEKNFFLNMQDTVKVN